jgi:hypothetical protein
LDVVVGGPDIERVGGLGNLICMFEEKEEAATFFTTPFSFQRVFIDLF